MRKSISISIEEKIIEELKKTANIKKRNLSNFIEIILEEYLEK